MWNKLQDKYSIFCPWFWKDLKCKIKVIFFPRNRWVMSGIPREWRDLDFIFEEVLFAGIIHYIEEEDALNSVVFTKKESDKLMEIYNWAKYGRKELENKISDSYPPFGTDYIFGKIAQNETRKRYDELYGEVNRLEKLLIDTNSKHLIWLIKNRGRLWT